MVSTCSVFGLKIPVARKSPSYDGLTVRLGLILELLNFESLLGKSRGGHARDNDGDHLQEHADRHWKTFC